MNFANYIDWSSYLPRDRELQSIYSPTIHEYFLIIFLDVHHCHKLGHWHVNWNGCAWEYTTLSLPVILIEAAAEAYTIV